MRLRTLSRIKIMDLSIYFKGPETGAATVNLLQPLRKQKIKVWILLGESLNTEYMWSSF